MRGAYHRLGEAGDETPTQLDQLSLASLWQSDHRDLGGGRDVEARRGISPPRISALIRARRENESNDVNNLRAIRVCMDSPLYALMHSPISGDCDTEDPGCCSMVAGAGCQKLQQEAQRDHSETTHVTNSRPGAESGFRLVRPGREPKGLAESTAQ